MLIEIYAKDMVHIQTTKLFRLIEILSKTLPDQSPTIKIRKLGI